MSLTDLTLNSKSVNPQQLIYEATNSNKQLISEKSPFDVTSIVPVRLERFYEEESRLIEQRNALLDHSISLTPIQQEQLENIDKRLDFIEAEIAQFTQQGPEIDVQAIENMIADNKEWIQNMAQKIRSQTQK